MGSCRESPLLVDGKNEVAKFGRSHHIRSSTFVAVRAKRASVNVAVLSHLHRHSPMPSRPTLPSAVSQIKDKWHNDGNRDCD